MRSYAQLLRTYIPIVFDQPKINLPSGCIFDEQQTTKIHSKYNSSIRHRKQRIQPKLNKTITLW